MRFAKADLKAAGFVGWMTCHELDRTGRDAISAGRGVYVVTTLEQLAEPPRFLARGTGGWFKGRDPNLPVGTLKNYWVNGAEVLYIGKARVLKKRISQLLDFGQGKPVAHWGGRLLWQIDGSVDTLVVAWMTTTEDPRSVEQRLLGEFRAQYGVFPYANLVG